MIWVVIVHLDSLPSISTRLFLLRCSNDWCQVGFPLGPVAIDELGHVLGLLVWVLKVDVGGLLGALEWLPVFGDAPWLLRRFHPGCSQYFQGQIDAARVTVPASLIYSVTRFFLDLSGKQPIYNCK